MFIELIEWRNEGPRCAGGHNLRGAQNHRSNVGQFGKT